MQDYSSIVTIRKIQTEYFRLLGSWFVGLWHQYKESGLEPLNFLSSQIAIHQSDILIVNRGQAKSPLLFQAEGLLNDIKQFWISHGKSLRIALENSTSLTVQIGDLNDNTMQYGESILRLGLYFDSVCLLDPFSIISQRRDSDGGYFTGRNDDPQLVQFILHYLDVRELEYIVMADSEVPIAIFAPLGGFEWGDNTFTSLHERAQIQTFEVFSQALDIPINSIDDLLKLVRDTEWLDIENLLNSHPLTQIGFMGNKSLKEVGHLNDILHDHGPNIEKETKKWRPEFKGLIQIKGTLEGAFLALSGAEMCAHELRIDIAMPPSLWEINNFRQHSDISCLQSYGIAESAVATHALLSEHLEWLELTNLSDLTRVRLQHGMKEIRDLFRLNRRDIQGSSAKDMQKVIDDVILRIESLLRKHKKDAFRLERAQKDWYQYVTPVVKTIVFGIALIPFSPLIALTKDISVPTQTLTDTIREYKEDKKRLQRLRNGPVSHLLDIRARSSNVLKN